MAKKKKNKSGDGSLGIAFRTNKAGERKVSNARSDSVSENLGDCQTPEEIAAFAAQFGINQDEINERVEKAPNFGQFRMVIGNRIRGIVNRIAKAKEKGEKLSVEHAAYPKKNTKTVAKGGKAPKGAKKKAAKKRSRKTVEASAD